jgi:hypothetical protein
MPSPADLPPGAHRDLVAFLYAFYTDAGRPSTRTLSDRMIRDRALPGRLSHQGVINALRGKFLPRWENLESLVTVLHQVKRVGPDRSLDDVLAETHSLWIRATENPHHTTDSQMRAESSPEPLLPAPPGPDHHSSTRIDLPHDTEAPPRIYISYCHDSAPHTEMVRQFATFMITECGFDVCLDQWDSHRRREWDKWSAEQLDLADFVIVIASLFYKEVGDRVEAGLDGPSLRTMQVEVKMLRERLLTDPQTWLHKLLPVILPGHAPTEIPEFLRPQMADHYAVKEFTYEGTEDLIRVITGQPRYHRPPINPTVVQLPPKSTP